MNFSDIKSSINSFLVEDWPQAWKWLSMQFAMLIVLWPTLPDDLQAQIVSGLAGFFGFNVSVPTILAVAVIVGRLVDQNKKLP